MTTAIPPEHLDTLFKFRGRQHRGKLDFRGCVDFWVRDRSVWFAAPSSLNDLFDCNPSTAAIPQHRRQEVIGIVSQKMTASATRTAAFLLTDEVTIQARHTRAELRLGLLRNHVEAFGVLSLSRSRMSPVMWSLYAERGHGFAVGYSATLLTTLPGVDFVQIGYSHERAHMWPEPDGAPPRFLRSKSEDWRFEEETRGLTMQVGDSRAWALPPDAITQVIAGPRMTSDERTYLFDVARALPDRPEMLIAEGLSESYGIIFRPHR